MKTIFAVMIFVLFAASIISTSIAVYGSVDSPRKQMENGISAEDVVCKNELQLMIRNNGDAICVKHGSVEKWIDWKMADYPVRDSKNSDVDPSVNEADADTSPEKILVKSARDVYNLGSALTFTGESPPNKSLEVSLEDSDGNEAYVDILEIDDSGLVYFEIPTDNSFNQGMYFLILKQGNDSEIVPVQIGESTGEIAAVIEKFHHDLHSQVMIEIFGPGSSNLSLTVLDSHDHVIFEDMVLLDQAGYAEYSLDLGGYKKGVYNFMLTHASEETIEEFTVGLRIGTSPIEVKLDDNYYKIGETVLLTGKSSDYAQILIELIDPTGEIIDKIEYYTDGDGKFTYPLEISLGKQTGLWEIRVSNGERVSEITFDVIGDEKNITIKLDKEKPYNLGDYVTISGTGINSESQSVIQITSSDRFYELTPNAAKDGTYSEVWQIPENWAPGHYTVLIDDGTDQATTKLQIIYKTTS